MNVAYSLAMDLSYTHAFSKEEVVARLQALGEYLGNKHGINFSWTDDQSKATFSGKYMVVSIEGELFIDGETVLFKGKDPGMLWRKKAKQYVDKKLNQYLDAAQPVDSLPRN